MITITAFQIGAFQFTAFQEAQTVSGSGGWILMSLAVRARRRAEQKRKEEEKPVAVVEYAPLPKLVPLRLTAKPKVTDLTALAAIPPTDPREAEDFKAFMELLVSMEEIE